MKKLIALLIISMFISCSNNDDDWETITSENIVGRWQMIDVETKVVNTNRPDITEELKSSSLEGTPMIEFAEGGLFIDEEGSEGRWYLDEREKSIRIEHSWRSDQFYDNISIKNNTLEWDIDMKEDAQKEINYKYPYEKIMIYDLILRVKSVRK